ncbi:serine-rich hypothetical protein [Limosa lapponica baueri]|uniref:Uncharacterized protein n=1 Tax=Limosa lapponica baueri TaxID=1758121 RepID=A0A2I0U9F8_LIMLA|nr:serine-rich hypothetical protein [Limosa lapponica baueri]
MAVKTKNVEEVSEPPAAGSWDNAPGEGLACMCLLHILNICNRPLLTELGCWTRQTFVQAHQPSPATIITREWIEKSSAFLMVVFGAVNPQADFEPFKQGDLTLLLVMRSLALGLVEPHKVYMSPLLKLVHVSPDGIPSLRRVNCTTQLGVICKLAEGSFDPTVCVIDDDTKQYWSQYGPLRDTSHH